jgi:predicted nucleic acid-binding protein
LCRYVFSNTPAQQSSNFFSSMKSLSGGLRRWRCAAPSSVFQEWASASEHATAELRLEKLRRGWRELQPSDALRAQAEAFLKAYTLKAADSLQLAAAWNYSDGKPQNLILISADAQLLEAARKAGFQIVAA